LNTNRFGGYKSAKGLVLAI